MRRGQALGGGDRGVPTVVPAFSIPGAREEGTLTPTQRQTWVSAQLACDWHPPRTESSSHKAQGALEPLTRLLLGEEREVLLFWRVRNRWHPEIFTELGFSPQQD